MWCSLRSNKVYQLMYTRPALALRCVRLSAGKNDGYLLEVVRCSTVSHMIAALCLYTLQVSGGAGWNATLAPLCVGLETAYCTAGCEDRERMDWWHWSIIIGCDLILSVILYETGGMHKEQVYVWQTTRTALCTACGVLLAVYGVVLLS